MGIRDEAITYLTLKSWKYSKGTRHKMVLASILFVFSNAFYFIQPLIVAWLFNTIQKEGIGPHNIKKLLLILLLFMAQWMAFWAFHGPARVIERTNAFIIRKNYKKYLLNGVLDLPLGWHTDRHSGDTIDRIEKGSRSLYIHSKKLYEIIGMILRVLSSYIALAYFNIHAGYIVLILMILALFVVFRMDWKIKKNYRELFRAENKISASIYDTVSNITTVIIIRIQKMLSKEIVRNMMKPFELDKKTNKMSELKWFFASCFASFMMVLVLGSYILSIYFSGTTIMMGTLYALYSYMERITNLFFSFAFKYGEIVKHKVAVENAEELAEHFEPARRHKTIDFKKNWTTLHIDDLSFSYESDKAELHLNNISLLIKNKEKIALVGESGSGKSTILKLIRGLYDTEQANIYINRNKKAKSFRTISDNMTLIPQDPELFATTIRKNITLGKKISDKKLREITDLACFTKVADRLPKGLESSVVEKGVNLSGGEKQRLALARGLLAAEDSPIILLDEPTSSVDARNELNIYENIFNKFNNRTILSSIHRLHMLDMFDTIYIFKKGKIVASGTLRQLLRDSENFKKLWDKYHKSQNVSKRRT